MFYDKFKSLCDKKGVSPKRAVTEIGLSNSLATKWKKTGATPNSATLVKIADYFGVTVESLISNNTEENLVAITLDIIRDAHTKTKKPATETGDGLSDEERKFIEWFRNQASEKDKALVRMIVEGDK